MKTTSHLIFTLLNLLFISVFSQQKIKVIDLENNQPISYAKVILEDGSYRNTETDGSINIFPNEKIIEIQSFGYEILKISEYKTSYFLTPKFKNIEEVIIENPKQNKFFRIGKIKKEKNSHSFIASKNTWSIVSFFESKDNPNYKFIKNIKFYNNVESTKKDATINLIIFKNENGRPSEEIWKSFTIRCKPGKKITTKNFKTPIQFPDEGLFIGFEWIINDENSFEQEFILNNKYNETKKTLKKFNNPYIYSQTSEFNEILIKTKSGWEKFNHNILNENRRLSIELTLTN